MLRNKLLKLRKTRALLKKPKKKKRQRFSEEQAAQAKEKAEKEEAAKIKAEKDARIAKEKAEKEEAAKIKADEKVENIIIQESITRRAIEEENEELENKYNDLKKEKMLTLEKNGQRN